MVLLHHPSSACMKAGSFRSGFAPSRRIATFAQSKNADPVRTTRVRLSWPALTWRLSSSADGEQPTGTATKTQEESVSQPPAPSTSAPASFGLPAVGGAAAAFGVALFVASRLLVAGPSLASLENNSIPLDLALANGKPTVMEFYANWCEVCRELVPTEYAVQEKFKERVNFVMLNIDNPKWAQEMSDYRVQGIPYFVFFDAKGSPLSAAVGRLPQEVLEGNTRALAQHEVLPYSGVRAQASSVDSAPASASRTIGPRDHA